MPSGPSIDLVVPRTPLIAQRPALLKLWRECRGFQESSFFYPIPSLALLSLAGETPESFNLSYLDENVGPVDPGRARRTAAITAITAMTCQAPRAYDLADAARRSGSHVVLGGIHPTLFPEEALRHADTVIAGEAESLWPRFLQDYLGGRPKEVYRSPAGRHADLSRSHVPRYDLVPRGKFWALPVQIGRGCPLGCEFCSVDTVHGRRYRHKDLAQVAEEIRLIKRLRPVARPRIFFTDDNLHLHRGFLEQLLETITPLKINWMAQMDISVGRDPKLLRRLSDSGCSQLLVGFESLDRDNLSELQPRGVKPNLLTEYGRLAGSIQSHGIRVLGMFIVGLDHDRPDVFRRVRDFILETRLHDAQITIQTPLPGTRLRARLQSENRLLEGGDWSRYNFFHVLYKPKNLTMLQLLRGQSWLYREIHSPSAESLRRAYWFDHVRRKIGHRPASGAHRT